MSQVVPDMFDQLIFAPRAPGIVVTLIVMHGDNDALTRHATEFANSDEGKRQAGKLLTVLEAFPELLERHDNPFNREDLKEELEDEYEIDDAFWSRHIMPFLEHDTTYTDNYAKPMAYFVEMFDDAGGVQRAQFLDYYNPQQMVGLRCYGSLLPSFYPEAAWPTT